MNLKPLTLYLISCGLGSEGHMIETYPPASDYPFREKLDIIIFQTMRPWWEDILHIFTLMIQRPYFFF